MTVVNSSGVALFEPKRSHHPGLRTGDCPVPQRTNRAGIRQKSQQL